MIKSRAIVLHRYAYSDSSWIVKALTEECGIVSFIVKGGKRKESPFKGALDPLALSEVVFRQNPNTELQFVKEATLLDWHKDMREDLLKTAKAQVMTEIVLRYAPAGVPLEGEFALLENALAALSLPANNAPDIKPPEGVLPILNRPQTTHPVFSPAGFSTSATYGAIRSTCTPAAAAVTRSRALRQISTPKRALLFAKIVSESNHPAPGRKLSTVFMRYAPAKAISRTRNSPRMPSSPTLGTTSGSYAK